MLSNEKYVAKNGVLCPYCGSTDLTGFDIDIDVDGAHQEVSCNNCHKSWTDNYKLVGFTPEHE